MKRSNNKAIRFISVIVVLTIIGISSYCFVLSQYKKESSINVSMGWAHEYRGTMILNDVGDCLISARVDNSAEGKPYLFSKEVAKTERGIFHLQFKKNIDKLANMTEKFGYQVFNMSIEEEILEYRGVEIKFFKNININEPIVYNNFIFNLRDKWNRFHNYSIDFDQKIDEKGETVGFTREEILKIIQSSINIYSTIANY